MNRAGAFSFALRAGLCACWLAAAIPVAAGVPRIACREPVHDFGSAASTSTVQHVFLIHNDGDAPLQIGKLRACCGSTMTMAATVIPPGSNAEAAVTFTLRGRSGRQRKTFYVGSGDLATPYLELRLEGDVLGAARDAAPNVDFGEIAPDQTAERSVTIVCPGGAVFAMTGAIFSANCLTGAWDRARGSEPRPLLVRTVPPLPLGPLNGRIRLLTDCPGLPAVDIEVRALVKCDLQAVPDAIVLMGGFTAPVTREVAVRSRSGRPFRILRATLPADGMRVETNALPAGGYRLVLTGIDAARLPAGGALVLATDHADAPRLVIPLRVLPQPSIPPAR